MHFTTFVSFVVIHELIRARLCVKIKGLPVIGVGTNFLMLVQVREVDVLMPAHMKDR